MLMQVADIKLMPGHNDTHLQLYAKTAELTEFCCFVFCICLGGKDNHLVKLSQVVSVYEIGGAGVVVIAATNRPEALDSALRRPGRFDRELEVGVPSPAARAHILRYCPLLLPLWLSFHSLAAVHGINVVHLRRTCYALLLRAKSRLCCTCPRQCPLAAMIALSSSEFALTVN